jgi:hypothetical protein
LRVPEGKYKVLCYLFNYAGYYQEYYDNTENINEAVIVNVPADSVTAGINFGVPLLPPDTAVVSFSGKVTDNTGTPLAKAYVRIELPGIYTGVIASPPDMGAATDENGFYKISFPLNKAFFAKKYIVIAQKEGYDIEFYKDKKNYYEADILYYDCTGIFKNINFSLDPVKPEKFYSISGKITDDKGAPVISGMVIGLDEISRNFYYALSDSAGFYSLTGLTSGKYYILFLAKGYVPEFYNNASRWEDASVIAADKDISNIDAALNRISPVDADSSFIILSGYIKSGDTPLPGVLVTVSNSLNEVIAYDITNASGEYRIEGLTKGSYNLQASLVNYSSKNEGLECRTSSGMQTVNFSMSPAAPTSVKEKTKILPLKTDLLPNYPNPFNPSTVITFDLSKTENTELKVYNIIGQEVATLINGRLNAGTYNIPFEAKGLGSGVYLYQLKTGSASIVKKMILTR